MHAETLTPLMVQSLSQTEASLPEASYYRSRLFVSSFGNNPLITAASPLFSLLDRLSTSALLPAPESLRQNLTHELQAFDSRLREQESSVESIQLARFMIRATIDESAGKNYLRTRNEVTPFQSFSQTADPEKSPQQLFFDVLNTIKTQPHVYLDVLEFAYFCLLSGMEGPYHNQPNGRQQLDELLDSLYHTIRQHRTHRPLSNAPPPTAPTPRKSLLWQPKHLWGALFFLTATLIGLSYYYAIKQKVQRMPFHPPASQGVYLP
ncbi:MAG: type IVB secretion system protein IcmH/DotU [Legionellaceae bacterium]|nr:type IVB secretion system protein IcmH/DotU [Legionellaceae bacterium]